MRLAMVLALLLWLPIGTSSTLPRRSGGPPPGGPTLIWDNDFDAPGFVDSTDGTNDCVAGEGVPTPSGDCSTSPCPLDAIESASLLAITADPDDNMRVDCDEEWTDVTSGWIYFDFVWHIDNDDNGPLAPSFRTTLGGVESGGHVVRVQTQGTNEKIGCYPNGGTSNVSADDAFAFATDYEMRVAYNVDANRLYVELGTEGTGYGSGTRVCDQDGADVDSTAVDGIRLESGENIGDQYFDSFSVCTDTSEPGSGKCS